VKDMVRNSGCDFWLCINGKAHNLEKQFDWSLSWKPVCDNCIV